MKSIVLGIMIASVSVSFAQTDDAPTHQLKRKFSAKQKMAVKPATMDVKDNAEIAKKPNFAVRSRKDSKSSVVNGVIRIQNGTPYILTERSAVKRQMMPVNLPKAMAIDGQKLTFTYTISDAPMPKNSKSAYAIKIYDVSIPARN